MTALVRGQSLGATKFANGGTVSRTGRDRLERRWTDELMSVARELSPQKTAAFLRVITGAPLRQCERWLSGEATISFRYFVRLMWSAHGDRFERAVMPEADDKACPMWWRRRREVMEMAALRKAHAEHARKLAQFEINFAADD